MNLANLTIGVDVKLNTKSLANAYSKVESKFRQLSKFDKPFQTIYNINNKINASLKNVQNTTTKINSNIKNSLKINSSIKNNINPPIKKTKEELFGIQTILKSIIALKTIDVFKDLALTTAEWGNNLNVTAKTLGITTDAIQRMNYMENVSGIQKGALGGLLETVADLKSRLPIGLGINPQQMIGFQMAGMSPLSIMNRDIDGVVDELINKLQGRRPEFVRLISNMIGFDPSIVLAGKVKINKDSILSKDEIDKLTKARELFGTIKADLSAMVQKFVVRFIPAIEDLSKAIQKVINLGNYIIKFSDKNGNLLSDIMKFSIYITAVTVPAIGILTFSFLALGKATTLASAIALASASAFKGLGVLFIGLGGLVVKTATLIKTGFLFLLTFLPSIKNAFVLATASILSACTVLLSATGVVGLIAIFKDLWSIMNGGEAENSKKIIEWLKNAFPNISKAVDTLEIKIGNFFETISLGLNEILRKFSLFANLQDKVTNKISDFFGMGLDDDSLNKKYDPIIKKLEEKNKILQDKVKEKWGENSVVINKTVSSNENILSKPVQTSQIMIPKFAGINEKPSLEDNSQIVNNFNFGKDIDPQSPLPEDIKRTIAEAQRRKQVFNQGEIWDASLTFGNGSVR